MEILLKFGVIKLLIMEDGHYFIIMFINHMKILILVLILCHNHIKIMDIKYWKTLVMEEKMLWNYYFGV